MSTYIPENEEINLSWIPSFPIDFNKSNEEICEYKEKDPMLNYCYLNIYFVSGKFLTFHIDKNEKLVNVKIWIIKFIKKHNKYDYHNLIRFDICLIIDCIILENTINITISEIENENIQCIFKFKKFDYDSSDYITYLTSRLIQCRCTYCTDYDDPYEMPFAPLCTIDEIGKKCNVCVRGIIVPEIELDLENLPKDIPQHIKATDVEWVDLRNRIKSHIEK